MVATSSNRKKTSAGDLWNVIFDEAMVMGEGDRGSDELRKEKVTDWLIRRRVNHGENEG